MLFIQTAAAQQTDFNFINFSTKDGLSSSAVNAILKDKRGYIWFGTEDGLNKFDGTNFTVYIHDEKDSSSIGGNVVTALHEDKFGNVWVGTSKTLSLYNPRKDAFVNYDFTKYSSIRALYSDHFGNIWVGGYAGLFKFDPRSGERKNYSSNASKEHQLKSNTILSVFEDSRNRLWVGTNAGLHLYIKNKDSFQHFQHVSNDSSSISDNIIRAIGEDLNGNIWIGSNNGLNKLQPNGNSFKRYKHSRTNDNSLSSNCIYAITRDKTGRLWIGTEDGLNIFEPASGKTIRIKHELRNKYSLIGKAVKSIYIDKNDIYWVGTAEGGVNKYDENLAFFNLRQNNPFDAAGLNASIVTSFAESPSGDIYVGTDGGGINLYNRKTGLFDHPKLTAGKEGSRLTVLAMERVDNELWVGTYQRGLYVLNIVSGMVKHYNKGDGLNDLLSNEIFCIKKDSQGNIWIGTNGDGVNKYDRRSGTFTRFVKNPTRMGDEKLPVNGFIRTIEEDKFGNIWIGTTGTGVAVYNPTFKNFSVFNSENSELPSNLVQSILSDKRGTIWLGTFGGGLSRFNFGNNKFTSYSRSEGLSNAVLYKVLEDEEGKIWVSTNKGLSRFDPRTALFKNYTFYNGLQRTHFILGAGLKTSDGELYFGGLDGFNYFNPLLLKSNKNVPSVQFTDLKISNRSVVPGEDAVIKEHISIAREIKLDYKQNFSIDFVALNYTEPQSSRYAYKLDGFDKEWNNVVSLHSAVYTNLSPGDYTFRLKAISDDGLWTTPEKTIKIKVSPPFWLTSYAFVFYFLVAGLLLLGFRYQAIRKVKTQFALEQERLKTRQIIDQEREASERKHEWDQSKIKFLTNLSHEFRTPISLIAGPVEKLLQNEVNEQKAAQLSMVKRNAGRLLNLVNQILDFCKLEEHELKLNLAEGDLVAFVKEVTELFQDISERKNIHFTFQSALPAYNTLFDKDKIERILFNLLSNAFKFTEKDGQITLSIDSAPNSMIKISITDTGVGMTTTEQVKIFDRFFQGDLNPDILNQGSGIGLSITREFVKLHGGTINVESIFGKGSKFTILLPCAPVASASDVDSPDAVASGGLPAQEPLIKEGEIPGHEKLTVLLIEDNEDFRYYLKDNLKSHYNIVEATNGKEGWQQALSSHPHVIVSDISMPQMDGITLCRKIKSDKRTSHIPVILLTALTGNANQLRGLQTGASDYLTKPFNFEILNVKIKNLVILNENLKNTYVKQFMITAEDIDPQSDDEKLLYNIIQYIESNIDSAELSVEDLSKHVFMSRRTLYNKIVSLTGETPVEFIRSIKLLKAAKLLESTDMRISEVGYAVGFTSANYFTRAFKAKFNMSPSEYLALKKRVEK